ncbi:MAG: TIR domain-containing protein [Parcubacteria group bacterium]|nr:TIR domain-containing protein [Parcubacteria group bacterium]
MSIESIAKQIATVDREINTIERTIQTIDGNISRKQKEANNILSKISSEKDLKRVITLKKDLTRKNDEIHKLEKDKNTKSKTLVDKQKKKLDFQTKLNREEQKERDKVKKEQKEILTMQQQITREMERQKIRSLHSIDVLKPLQYQKRYYDVFISHASEDKEDFVGPFANCLKESGLNVWYDEFELQIGDSLRRAIDNGLRNSRYGIVILSEAFFSKEWPQRELDSLFAREVNGEKVILPIWHKISKNEVLKFSPLIADMLAINTSSFTIEEIAQKISERVIK